MRIRLAIFLSLLLLAFQNCAKPAQNVTEQSSGGGGGGVVDTICPQAATGLRNPRSIDEVTTLINALPKPLTLECLLQNLSAPLSVMAVDSIASAQPSAGSESPRLFIMKNPLILSVVPAGPGRNLLEMSQLYVTGVTVKAELTFPIAANIPTSAPYDEIRSSGTLSGTSCRVCHSNEYQATGFAGPAFASDVLRPSFGKEVYVSTMRAFAGACSYASDPYRCAILRAVFVKGAAEQGFFPF